jgi:hypothetical protein
VILLCQTRTGFIPSNDLLSRFISQASSNSHARVTVLNIYLIISRHYYRNCDRDSPFLKSMGRGKKENGRVDARARADLELVMFAPAAPTSAIPLQATPTAGASTAPAVATTPLIGPIISLLDATQPLAIHRSGRRHRFRRPRALAVSPLPPPNQHPPLPNPGMSSSSVLGPTLPCVPPAVSAEFHLIPPPPVSAMEAGLPKPGTASASSSSSDSQSPPSLGRTVVG